MEIRDKLGIPYGDLDQVLSPGQHILVLKETWSTSELSPPDLPGSEVV